VNHILTHYQVLTHLTDYVRWQRAAVPTAANRVIVVIGAQPKVVIGRDLFDLRDLLGAIGRCKVIQTLVTFLQELVIVDVLLRVAVEVTHMLRELLLRCWLKHLLIVMVMVMVLGRGFYLRRCLSLLLLWDDRLCCNLICLEIIILSIFLVVISW
jgi:hypothetical protein